MTLPTAIAARHVHVTEREVAHTWPDGQKDDAKWEDCVFVSAVEFVRLATPKAITPSHYEAETLRDASGIGPLGGTNANVLSRGLQARYGWTGEVVAVGDVWARMTPGVAAVALGSQGAFPVGSTYRRFDPGYTGGHATLAVRIDAQDRVWWCDPLAPLGVGYNGQWMSGTDFRRFIAKGAMSSMVARLYAAGDIVQAAITDVTPKIVNAPQGATLFDLDGTTPATKTGVIFANRFSPYGVGSKRAVYATLNGVKRLYLVSPTAIKDIPVPPVVADTTPYSQAQYDEAKASAESTGINSGKLSERDRIRTLLGL